MITATVLGIVVSKVSQFLQALESPIVMKKCCDTSIFCPHSGHFLYDFIIQYFLTWWGNYMNNCPIILARYRKVIGINILEVDPF